MGDAQVKFFGDHDGSWTRALGMEVDLSVALLGMRSQRYSLYIENGLIIKVVPCSTLSPPSPLRQTARRMADSSLAHAQRDAQT
jgi:peroxiredoxin